MAVMYNVIEEPEEIRDHQVANVQAVDVRVGRKNHFLVTEAFDVVFDIEAAHQVVHLIVLVNDVAFEVPNVERLAFQNKDGLGVDIAATDDGAGRGLALGNENHRASSFVLFLVKMNLAIFQLWNAD